MKMKCKRSKWMALLVVLSGLLAPAAHAQLLNFKSDPEIAGTYSGAILPVRFSGLEVPNPPPVPGIPLTEDLVISALFEVTIGLNAPGYHSGATSSSIVFVNGRARPTDRLVGSFLVSPYQKGKKKKMSYTITGLSVPAFTTPLSVPCEFALSNIRFVDVTDLYYPFEGDELERTNDKGVSIDRPHYWTQKAKFQLYYDYASFVGTANPEDDIHVRETGIEMLRVGGYTKTYPPTTEKLRR